MADVYSVSGFIELSEKQLEILEKVLRENVDGNPYNDSWIVHRNGGWACYAFYGHTLKASTLGKFREQLRTIARIVHTKDPDVPWRDHPRGRFSFLSPDEDSETLLVLSQGQLHESPRA